jgi:iron complex transport system substrate-binding protein
MVSVSKKLVVFGLIAIIVAVLFVACGGPAESPSPTTTSSPAPLTVTDQLGRTVTIKARPQRIVSVAPSNTEIVYALGLADRLVARTDYCDYPPEALEKPSIGGFSTPNIEQIVAVAPDLVLAASIHEDKIIPQLEARGLTVLALDPKTVDEVMAAIELVGRVAGVEDNARALVDSLEKRVRAVTDKTASLPPEQVTPTFYVLWHDPLMTAGADTLQDELISLAGGRNIGQDVTDYADYSLEAVIAADPAVIVAAISHGGGGEDPFVYARDEARLRDTAARRNGHVYAIDGNLTSRPGPRIVDGLERLAEFIHPEIFGPPQE